jgi:hypothetical protein
MNGASCKNNLRGCIGTAHVNRRKPHGSWPHHRGLLWGADEYEDRLEEAGEAAGREWAHSQTGSFEVLKRVEEDWFEDYWGLVISIAGVDAEAVWDAMEAEKYDDPVVRAVYKAQWNLIPDRDALSQLGQR